MPRTPIIRPWSEEDDDALRRIWLQPLSITQVARRMKRGRDTVKTRAARLGLPPKSSSAEYKAANADLMYQAV